MKTRNARALASIAVVAFLSGCGGDATAPSAGSPELQDVGGNGVPSHPAGIIAATTPLAARPFGASITRERGIVMITQLDAATVARGTLPSSSLPVSIGVGFIPTNVTFDAAGRNAFVTNQVDATVGFIDVSTNTQVATTAVPMSTFNVAYCSANRRLYVTGPGSSVYVINAITRGVIDSISTNAVTNGVTANAKCTRVFVSDESNGRVLEINPLTNAVVRTLPTGGAPKDLAVHPNGRRLYVADETGAVQVWNLQTGLLVTSVPLPAGAFGLALSPDGAQVYAGMPSGAGVVVLSTASNTIINTIATGGSPRKIAFSGNGKAAVIANEGGWVDYIN